MAAFRDEDAAEPAHAAVGAGVEEVKLVQPLKVEREAAR
jgi:hypothetical protein